MPITKPLSVVVHRMSYNEINLVMSKPRCSEVNTETLKFVDSLWSEDDMCSEAEVSDRWITTENEEEALKMDIS